MSNVKPVPKGYHTVTPYMVVKNASDALEFYKKAFNATEVTRMPDPSGLIMHAEINIGDSRIMLCDEMPEQEFKSPQTYGGSPMSLMLYVEDVDAMFEQASKAGGSPVHPVEDQFYGDRSGTLKDPFGHIWTLATHIEDVPYEEAKKRMENMQT